MGIWSPSLEIGRSNDYRGKVGETPINTSTAQSLRVGENPLNGNGLPLTLFKIYE